MLLKQNQTSDSVNKTSFSEKYSQMIVFILLPIVPVNQLDFRDRFNAIITEHIVSIRDFHLHRENLDENQYGIVLRRLIQEFSPETLQSFQNDPSGGVVRSQIQERDNDRLVQHLLDNDRRLAELARIQQENNARIQQHLLDQDERLAALQRFLDRDGRINRNEHLTSPFRIPEMQQQGQAGNERIVGQLLHRIEQLTEIVVQQQQEHVRNTESLRQPVNRSLENNELLRRTYDQASASSGTEQQQQQGFHFNFNTLRDLIQTTVLLCTLVVLIRNR
jgi:hypothetical protein